MVMLRTRSYYVQQFGQYLKKNWINLFVLVVVLSLSAAASIILYLEASSALDHVSNELLNMALTDTKYKLGDYFSSMVAIVATLKPFLESRTLPSGVVQNPDIRAAVKTLGYIFRPVSSEVFGVFYQDDIVNLGWAKEDENSSVILAHWEGIIDGLNFYIPENGTIGNFSQPLVASLDAQFPSLVMAEQTGQPYWAPVFMLKSGATTNNALLPYVQPVYFDDTGDYCCLAGVSIFVKNLEELLSDINVVESGKIFITDENGRLMADSEGGLESFLHLIDETSYTYDKAPLPNATQNTDLVMAHAAQYLENKYGSFSNIPDRDQHLTFTHKGSKQILLVGQYTRDNLKVFVIIVLPYSAFFARIAASRRITISLTVIAGMCGILRYLIAWRMIAKHNQKIDPKFQKSDSTESNLTPLPSSLSPNATRDYVSPRLAFDPTVSIITVTSQPPPSRGEDVD